MTEDRSETTYHGPPKGEADFFVDPPAEIGELVSAHTSLAKHVQPTPFAVRFAWGAGISAGLVAVIVGGTTFLHFADTPHKIPLYVLIPGVVALSALVVWLVCSLALGMTSFEHSCGYVGTKGCAMLTCNGDREKPGTCETCLYDEASDLRVELTHFIENGSYQRTRYIYAWTNEKGRRLLYINDAHNSQNAPPPSGSSYNFAVDAEAVWSHYLIRKILPDILSGGEQAFALSGKDCLVVRKDELVLRLKGKKQVFGPEDIAEMQIQNGTISLKEPGAKSGWFTSTGIHTFAFKDLSNAQVFLLLMEHLYQIPIN